MDSDQPTLDNHGPRTVDPLKQLNSSPTVGVAACDNHGPRTVDPLKLVDEAEQVVGPADNHGPRTVDPLKLNKAITPGQVSLTITTVLGPWTH